MHSNIRDIQQPKRQDSNIYSEYPALLISEEGPLLKFLRSVCIRSVFSKVCLYPRHPMLLTLVMLVCILVQSTLPGPT